MSGCDIGHPSPDTPRRSFVFTGTMHAGSVFRFDNAKFDNVRVGSDVTFEGVLSLGQGGSIDLSSDVTIHDGYVGSFSFQ
jgi:hypothetical protein